MGDIALTRLVNKAPGFLASKDYNSLAQLGAAHAANYLEEGLASGKSEEDVSFMPELHIYKDVKCVG